MGIFSDYKLKKEQEKQELEKQKLYAEANAARQKEIEEKYKMAKEQAYNAMNSYEKKYANSSNYNDIEKSIIGANSAVSSFNDYAGARRANNIATEMARELQSQMTSNHGKTKEMINKELGGLYTRISDIFTGKNKMAAYENVFYPVGLSEGYIALPVFIEYMQNNTLSEKETAELHIVLDNIDNCADILKDILKFYYKLCLINSNLKNQFSSQEAIYNVFPKTVEYINSLEKNKGISL